MYSYQDEKKDLFTEHGQVLFIAIRDKVKRLIKESGAVKMDKAISGNCGDSWLMMACIDRMVEMGELKEIAQLNPCSGQNRIFVSSK